MHIYCKTPVAILLAGFPGDGGVLRFPSADPTVPGLRIEIDARLPVLDQLFACLTAAIGASAEANLVNGRTVEVDPEFSDVFTLSDGRKATLYVARVVGDDLAARESWFSFREILEGMERSRLRLIYLKALQVLTGGLSLETRAIETDDTGPLRH